MNSNWYSPSEIRFTKDQVRWMLRNWDELSEGQWIPQCEDTGYTGYEKRNCHAPFEYVMQVIGELDARLSVCSTDGMVAIEYYSDYNSDLSRPSTAKTAKNVVGYCSGYKRPQLPYQVWLMVKQEFRQKYRIGLVR